ncbi:MAG: hypothetical protein WKF56_01345 [Candidatus Limnocylindrales bacterium]
MAQVKVTSARAFVEIAVVGTVVNAAVEAVTRDGNRPSLPAMAAFLGSVSTDGPIGPNVIATVPSTSVR